MIRHAHQRVTHHPAALTFAYSDQGLSVDAALWFGSCARGAFLVLAWFSGEPSVLLVAITAICIYGGRGPGLLSIGICGAAFGFFLLSPESHFFATPLIYLRFGFFLGGCARHRPSHSRPSTDQYFIASYRARNTPDRGEYARTRMVERFKWELHICEPKRP